MKTKIVIALTERDANIIVAALETTAKLNKRDNKIADKLATKIRNLLEAEQAQEAIQ